MPCFQPLGAWLVRSASEPQTEAGTNIATANYLTEVLMKRALPRCHLRFATSGGYDQGLSRARNSAVEQSVEEYAINQPIGATHEDAPRYSDELRHADIEGICANPLRDEPHPLMVAAVRRFGVVGLVAGAVGTAVLRWWKGPQR
jgi:hypothetical protein